MKQYGLQEPASWKDPNMVRFVEYKLHHTNLSTEIDQQNKLMLITERQLLRWVTKHTPALSHLTVPLMRNDVLNERLLEERGSSIYEEEILSRVGRVPEP